jgi:pimeloyl-ACP methyl ester carboxylesterase
MPEFGRGRVAANGITFEYLEAGSGPLALCMHGFPDSPFTYRHLLPALADAGFHAVAPFVRGFAPTELPPLRHHVHTSVMVADQIALARALGGGADALLVAHDWGAVGAWGALGRAPELWGRAVIINIPPFDIFGENLGTYSQIKKSFYFWYFQMQRVIEDRIRQNDFAFIRDSGATGLRATRPTRTWSTSATRWRTRTTFVRRSATTGANSTRPGSARRSGRPSRRPRGAGARRSPSCTCTARTTAATA